MRSRSSLLGAVAAIALAGPAGLLGAQGTIPVKSAVTVAGDSVRVGDPFRVTVGIRAPVGATIDFPRALDSTGAVQSLDPVVVRTSADTSATEQYAEYRVAAWDIGKQPIHIDEVIVKVGSLTRRVPVNGASIFVKSVLPTDTSKRVPKPPRDLFEATPFPWWLWALIAAAVIGLIWLFWWWRRRRRAPKLVPSIDPYQQAEADFERIEKLALLDAGERGRYVTLMIEVLRDYLAARHRRAPLSLTSTELQRAVRDVSSVPQDRLSRVLIDADLIKFARRAVSTDRARDLGREARAIVAAEHAAIAAEAAAAAAAAAAAPAEAA